MRLVCAHVGIVLAACHASARAPAPIANTQPPAPKRSSPCAPGWLEQTQQLQITETANGHFGVWEMHLVLVRDADRRHPDAFQGQVIGVYRTWYGEPAHVELRTLELPVADVVAMLGAMRDGIAMREPASSGRHVVVHDSSMGLSITVDALGPQPQDSERAHVQFFTDDGASQPQSWRIRACDNDLSWASRGAVTRAYARLARAIQRDAVYDAAYAKAQKP